jgi:hypothetical protein
VNDLSRVIVPSNATDFWTFVIAMGTWVLVIGALRSLSSLKLTKQDMADRKSRREREAAIEATQTFVHDILPGCETLLPPYRSMGFNSSDWKDVRLGENETEYFEKSVALLARINQDFRIRSVEILNALEAWSMVVTSGLAEDELTFLGCGTTYCSAVRVLLPIIIYGRKTRSPKAVESVAELYTRWSKRIGDLGLENSDEPFWARLPRTLGR